MKKIHAKKTKRDQLLVVINKLNQIDAKAENKYADLFTAITAAKAMGSVASGSGFKRWHIFSTNNGWDSLATKFFTAKTSTITGSMTNDVLTGIELALLRIGYKPTAPISAAALTTVAKPTGDAKTPAAGVAGMAAPKPPAQTPPTLPTLSS